MPEAQVRKLSDIESSGEVELGRGEVISNIDLATWPGSYPVYSSSASGEGEFGRYGKYMFDEELITWSIDGGGRPFYRRRHKFSVTNVSGYLRVKRRDIWNYRYLHALLSKLWSGIQFDYQMKAHPSAIRDLYKLRWIPIEEQEEIAQILDTLDTQIRQTEALIAKLERIKQGLLTDLLTRGIDEDGQLRPTPDQAPHLYNDSPLGSIPREWSVQRLVELGDSGLMNGVFKEPSRVGSGVPLVNVADLYRSQSVDPGTCERFAATQTEIDKFSAMRGDIFFTRSSLKLAGIAQTSYMAIDPGSAVFECHVMRLRPNQEHVVPRFLKEWCVGRYARQHFMANAKQVTMTTISQDGISSLLCPVPSLKEQWKAAEHIDGIDAQINSERVALRKLMRQKAGLMDDLLIGRVRVTSLVETKVQAIA